MLVATVLLAGFSPSSRLPAVRSPPLPRTALVASERSLRDFIRVDGAPEVRSFETASPDGKPIMLYIPGIEFSGYSFHLQADELGEDFDVRYFTVPQADRTPFDGLVSTVSEAVTQLSADGRPVYLLGESFGGALALSVALCTPNSLVSCRQLDLQAANGGLTRDGTLARAVSLRSRGGELR